MRIHALYVGLHLCCAKAREELDAERSRWKARLEDAGRIWAAERGAAEAALGALKMRLLGLQEEEQAAADAMMGSLRELEVILCPLATCGIMCPA
jgi:hypothetical protein